MTDRRPMVGWYDPPRLMATAIRVAISTVFGEFADRREAMASARKIDPREIDPVYDYSTSGSEFWFDFVADTGDGWNSTYAIARLLAAPHLTVQGHDDPLPLADILVMGGDEVYPTASRDEYAARLVAPFEEAAKDWPKDFEPHVYAIPGNHDWYDGLSAFLGLFCRRRTRTDWAAARQGRLVGARRTQQTHSYFALKLPHDWWLWGVDIQLAGYIDQPQIDFFDHVAREWMAPGSRLILCTGQPVWAYVDVNAPDKTFKNFSYLEGLVGLAKRGHRLCLVLTGDSHHYSRYTEGDCQYITAGGGGAFLHPTHALEDKTFQWDYPAPGQPLKAGVSKYQREFKLASDPKTGEPMVFPSRSESRRLTLRNLGFAILNWQYAATLAVVCAVFAWMLDTNARTFGSSLFEVLTSAATFWAALWAYVGLVFASPWPPVLVLAAFAGYRYFADFSWRLLAGVLHASAQALVVVIATILLAFYMPGAANRCLLIFYVGLAGGVLAATVMGVYLLVSLNWFGKHANEAFSALRIEDYKCFLRCRIDDDGKLTVFPVGLTNVPRDDGTDPPRNPPLKPHLIEQPVQIG